MGACFARPGVPVDRADECARLLLADARGRETLDARNSDGDTALHLCCLGVPAKLAVVRRLARAGAAIDVANAKGETPRSLAADRGLDLLEAMTSHSRDAQSS
mmetsp:Transcript_4466/g.18158  ORF Transcript_4466/g.18158 Transcript_4466/m.18158 type:complete len:103 (-) Transcript_4466:3513-3821(-)